MLHDFFLFLARPQNGLAQQSQDFEYGILRIKVSEELASQLERTRPTRSEGNALRTGINSIDQLSQQFDVGTLHRVFRQAGKFEAKHRNTDFIRW